jgi:elongation factor P
MLVREVRMVTASQLRAGMAVRYDGQVYKILAAIYHPGQGKMGGSTHARLKNLNTGSLWEHSFRSDLKLEDLAVEKQAMDYIYTDADACYFMNPESFEQVPVPASVIGPPVRFLQPEMRLAVEFVEEQPVSVLFPDIIEVRIAETAPAAHQHQDSTWKSASLENGVEITVPQFIKVGDVIRLDVHNLKYVDRAKGAK